MRIGIDATCWMNRRGFGRFTRELLRAVAELETDDEYILFADQQTAREADFPAQWRVVIGRTQEAPSQAAAADGRRSLRDMWMMRRAVLREPLDLMFFPAVYSYFPVGGRVPCLVTFHDVIADTLPHLVFHTRRSRLFWDLKCRAAIRRANRILTVSKASKQGLIDHFGLSESRVCVMPEAPSAAFRPVVRESDEHHAALTGYGIDPKERFFLYVGGISPHKNLGTLIEAFARLAEEPVHRDVWLVLVGDYAGDVFRTCKEDLSVQAAKLGVAKRVLFPGFVPDADLAHLYAASQAFVFPSYLEGFGLPAVEAMSCGAPVLASDRGSLPEVLDGAGDLFDPHDAAALTSCLRGVLQDTSHQQELRQRSLLRARDFSWEKSARRVVEVFRGSRNGRRWAGARD